MALPMMGPRNSVVQAYLRGDCDRFMVDLTDEVLRDDSPWIILNQRMMRWGDMGDMWDLSELWIDKVHDYVWDGDE